MCYVKMHTQEYIRHYLEWYLLDISKKTFNEIEIILKLNVSLFPLSGSLPFPTPSALL